MRGKFNLTLASPFLGIFSLAGLFIVSTQLIAAPARTYSYCIIEECTPAYVKEATDHGIEITPPSNRECGIQKECRQLAQSIEKLAVDDKDCVTPLYGETLQKIATMGARYADLGEKYNIAMVSSLSKKPNVSIALEQLLKTHFENCAKAKLFPVDASKCITQECTEELSRIQTKPISEEGCKEEFSFGNELSGGFHFEEAIISAAKEAHKQACIDANITKIEVEGNHILGGYQVYKKDLPTLQSAIKAEKEAVEILKAFEVNREECSISYWGPISQSLKNMRDDYAKVPASKNEAKTTYDNLSTRLDVKLVECERKGFLQSPPYGTCYTSDCEAREELAKNFQMGERTCESDVNRISTIGYMLKSEKEYIEDLHAELTNQCVDAGYLHEMYRKKVSKKYATVSTPSTPSITRRENPIRPPSVSKPIAEPSIVNKPASLAAAPANAKDISAMLASIKEDPGLTPEQAALLKRFYAMDVREKTGGPNGAYKIVPYGQISSKLKRLRATAADCDPEKVFIPIYSSVVYFEDLFEAEQLPFPQELIDLRNEVWKYRDMCVKAGY